MMPSKSPRLDMSARANVSIAADVGPNNPKLDVMQASAPAPQPYVAYFQGPEGRTDRFMIQGIVDRDDIALAAQALVDLLDAIDGDPDEENFDHDLEDDDPDSSVDDKPCDPDSDDDNILPIPGGGSGI